MPSAQYDVVLSMRAEGDLTAKVGAMAGKVHEHISGIGDIGKRVGDVLVGIADKALDVATTFAKWGVAGGVALAGYGVASLNKELETTQISLAAIFSRQGFTADFAGGMQLAADQVGRMKQDVKTLPGDLGQLAGIMTMIATPAAAGGANADQIRKLAGKTMLTAGILGVPQEVASREMAGLLAGRAGSHNILGSRLGFIGGDAEKLNKEDAAQRVKDITSALSKYDEAAGAFGQSWTAQITTLRDNVKYVLLAPATAPLFDHVKQTIGDINDYFDKNKDKVDFFVGRVGTDLAYAWDRVADAVARIGPILGGMLEKVQSIGALNLIEKVGGQGVGLALLAKTVPGLFGGAGSVLGSFGKVAAGGAAGGSAMGPIGGLMGLAGVEALAVSSAAAAGELSALANPLSQFHMQAEASAEHMQEATTRLVDKFDTSILPRLEKWGVTAVDHLAGAIDLLSDPVGTLAGVINAATGNVDLFGTSLGEMAARMLTFDFGSGIGQASAATLHGNELADRHNALRASTEGLPTELNKRESASTTIQKVEIIVKGSDDPSRVARLTAAELKKFAANPTRSKFAYNPAEPNMGG